MRLAAECSVTACIPTASNCICILAADSFFGDGSTASWVCWLGFSSQEYRARSSGGSRRHSSGGKLEKAGAKRDLVLRRRLALERAWRDTGVGVEAASELEVQGAAGVATDVEAEFSNSELNQRVRVFRGQTAPPGG